MSRKIDPKRQVSTDSPSMRRIVRVISVAAEPLDGYKIADLAHVAFNTFQNQYRHMLVAAGLVHVAGWKHNTRGPFVPLYAAGPLVGDPPALPKKIDASTRSKAWKERTGYNERYKAQRRLERPPDPVMAALLGLTARYHKTTTKGAAGAGKELAV